MTFYDKLQYLPVIIPVLIAAAVLHELAHAAVATWLGDPTPKNQGRLTLNPIKHLDPFGSAMFLFTYLFTSVTFGWARPVMVQRNRFRKPQRDMALVAIAGPLVNFAIGIVLVALVVHVIPPAQGPYVTEILRAAISINIVLSVFNMLPIPPLDGSRIVGAFMPRAMYEDWSKLDEYAIFFFLIIFLIFQNQFSILIGDGSQLVYNLMLTIVGA